MQAASTAAAPITITATRHARVQHLMLDLETLDTGPRAKILSVGALAFDPAASALPPADEQATFYGVIDAASYDRGAEPADAFTESAETRAWWARQNADARAEVLENPAARPWRAVVREFAAWVRAQAAGGAVRVWANSPAFDCVILRHALGAAGVPVPWRYYAERDVRSLAAVSGHRYTTFRKLCVAAADGGGGTAHHALDDCRFQARFVQFAQRALGRPRADGSDACVLYTGPMYAGKTDALIAHLRYARAAARARVRVPAAAEPLVLKHVNDVARHGERLVSRSGAAWDGPVHAVVSLDHVFEDRALLTALATAPLVAVDEAQFFAPRALAAFVRTCVERVIPVVLSGLSAVADGTPWPAMAAVQPFVSRTVHLRADCAACGTRDAATLTQRQTPVPPDGDPIYVASHRQEDAVYRPLCVACYSHATSTTEQQ